MVKHFNPLKNPHLTVVSAGKLNPKPLSYNFHSRFTLCRDAARDLKWNIYHVKVLYLYKQIIVIQILLKSKCFKVHKNSSSDAKLLFGFFVSPEIKKKISSIFIGFSHKNYYKFHFCISGHADWQKKELYQLLQMVLLNLQQILTTLAQQLRRRNKVQALMQKANLLLVWGAKYDC